MHPWVILAFFFFLHPVLAGSALDGAVMYGDRGRKEIALTFDICSGSNSHLDEPVIRALEEQEVKATFFISGRWMEVTGEAIERLRSNRRFELGLHGHGHPHLDRLDRARIREEVRRSVNAFRNKIGITPLLMRAPFGHFNEEVLEEVRAAGMDLVQWDLPSGDPSKAFTARMIRQEVLSRARNGSIVVFHANGRGWHTAEALPGILVELKKRGYQLVTVSELLEHAGENITRGREDQTPGLK